jgi:hypothetical protein
MANEEEVEETEEEDEEEEPVQRKKRAGGGKGTRPRGRMRKDHGSRAEPRLYGRDVPIGPNAVALEDVPMDIDRVERIGGFDEQSARIAENSRRVLQRKARGEADVRFNGDSRTKYFDIRKFYGAAIISIKQVYPVVNEGIPPVSFSACPTYDSLLQHVRERHWKGEEAAYEWRAYTETKSALGIGRFQFAADPDWEPRRSASQESQQHQQQPQQPQMNPYMYGGYPPPNWGPQQAPAPQQPPPQSSDGSAVGMALAQNAELIKMLLGVAQQNPNQQMHPALMELLIKMISTPQQPAPAPAPPPAAPAPNPVEQIETSFALVERIAGVGDRLKRRFGGDGGGQPTNDPPQATEDDGFPFQVRKIGPFSAVAKDGELDQMATAAANVPLVTELIDKIFSKGRDVARERVQAEKELIELQATKQREHLEMKRQEVQLEERRAVAKQMQANPVPYDVPVMQKEQTLPWQPEPWKPPPMKVEETVEEEPEEQPTSPTS